MMWLIKNRRIKGLPDDAGIYQEVTGRSLFSEARCLGAGASRAQLMEEHMKSILTSIAAASLLAAAAMAQAPQPRYKITDLGTLGGNFGAAFQINNAGWVAGSGNLFAGGPQHAWLWYGSGPLHDLGTLGGAACPGCNSEADGPNAMGEAAVGSETSRKDPNREDFCGYGTHAQCLGAIWKNGALTALSTLPGGNNANAFNLNNRGQVVGFSENGIADATCASATPFQAFRFEAVIWGPDGRIKALNPLPGDTVSFATGINNSGQVVGTSGPCSTTGLPPFYANGQHAVLWESDGSAHPLGSLGGAMTNAGTSINDRGEVVGASQSSSDGNIHAFLWTRGTGMQDLGTLPGAIVTVAPCCNTINNSGQVVGFMIDGSFTPHALLWQNNMVMDLNNLIPAGSGWYLQFGDGINDAGEIVGQGVSPSGDIRGFLLTPSNGAAATESVSPALTGLRVLPDNARKALLRAPMGGFGIRSPGQK
jgi:probable HAF family extracellular repeat protein